jgi:hypothetical protein
VNSPTNIERISEGDCIEHDRRCSEIVLPRAG